MKTPTDKLLPTLATWELADLQELQAALEGLIEALSTVSGDASTSDDEANQMPVAASPAAAKGGRGHIETKYIPRGNKRHGPYLYLRYWQDGKLRSKYLGKPRS